MKKFLISTLVVAMGLGLGATAFAMPAGGAAVVQPAVFSDIAGHQAEGELTLLGAMGVFTGEAGLGGAVKPDDTITRAQFCKVVVTAMGRASTAAGLGGLEPTFTDGASIPSWAWGFVNTAVYMGIINGYEDGSFGPNNPVTYAEAVTMLIRSVSGRAAAVGAGIWPYNFLFYGVDNGFTGGVDVGFANLPCTRGDMARMMVATMRVNKLNAKGEELEGTAVLYEGYQEDGEWEHVGNVYTGTLAYYANGVAEIDNAKGDFTVTLGDKVWLVGASDYSGLLNLPVFIVENDDGGFFIWATGEANVVTGIVKDPWGDADNDGNPDCVVLMDGTKVPYDEDEGDLYGTVNHDPDRCLHDLESDGGAEIAVTMGDDGLAKNFVATEFDSIYTHSWSVDRGGNDTDTNFFFVVTDVAPEAATYKADDPGTWMTFDASDGYTDVAVPRACAVTINGQAATPSDLKVGDVIDLAWDWENSVSGYYPPFAVRVHREVVEGTVAGTSTSYPGMVDKITIDLKAGGTKTYTVDWNGTMSGTPLPGKGDNVKYGLDFGGKVLALIGYETLTPYAVVKGFTIVGEDEYQVTLDVRGKEVTYKTDGTEIYDPYAEFDADEDGYSTWAELAEGQGLVYVEVDTATGTVLTEDSWVFDCPCCNYEVLAVDAANGTLTLDEDGNVLFFDDPNMVVYKEDADGNRVYVGLEGLKAGDWLTGCACDYSEGCGPAFLVIDEPT